MSESSGRDDAEASPEDGPDSPLSPSPDGPPSPARPENRNLAPNIVPPSAGEPPSWFLDEEASRPNAPSPTSWTTPPFRDVRAPGPRWEKRAPSPEHNSRFSRFGIILVAAAIVIAGSVIGLGIAVSGRAPQAQPSAASPQPTSSASSVGSASPTPRATASTTSPKATPTAPVQSVEPLPPADGSLDAALQSNPLYALPAPELSHCPQQTTLSDEQEWRKVVRQQWKCVHEAWVPIFEKMGWSTTMPEVMFYPGVGSKSDCGYFEAPAFYCAAKGGSVFFGGEHLQMAEEWDLSVNEMVNHEYSHHIQALAGISQAWAHANDADGSLMRRSELQAVCWSGMMTVRNDAVEFGADDVESWGKRLRTMQESEQHGTRASLVDWGTRGLQAQTIGDCNTWTVDAERVR